MQLCSWALKDGLRVGGLISSSPPPRALFLNQQSRQRREPEMHPQRKTHSPPIWHQRGPSPHAIHSASCSTTHCCTVQPAALSFLSPSSFPIRRRGGGLRGPKTGSSPPPLSTISGWGRERIEGAPTTTPFALAGQSARFLSRRRGFGSF